MAERVPAQSGGASACASDRRLPVGPENEGPDNPPAQQEVSTSFSPKKYIIKECVIGESDNGRRMSANLENPF